jgi:hypothetical protein
VQHWVAFFADLSTEAQFLLSRVNSPAARQLLAYHHTATPSTTGVPDPLRGAFSADLAALGDWPITPRLVSVVNGAGNGSTQGFAPSAQIISYEYRSFLLDICGNVWAVPATGSTKIFDGELNYFLLPDENLEITVSGTLPYDNAPGGRRDSMAQMDAVSAPFGNIVALHDNHCFIPTVASLALVTSDLFYDVDGDPNLVALTPFDAIWVPTGPNEDHVEVTAESAPWILDEVRAGDATGAMSAVSAPTASLSLGPAAPQPMQSFTSFRFQLPTAARTHAAIYDIRGRIVDVLLDERREAGVHELSWSRPGGLPNGVYFLEVEASGAKRSQRVVVID